MHTPPLTHPHMPTTLSSHTHAHPHTLTPLFTHMHTHTSLHIHTHLPSSHTQIAAQSLREVTDEFLEEGNPIITVAKMSQQMFQMAEFTHGRGELRVCTFLSVCPSIYLSVSLSVCLSVCPSIYLAVSLSVCLSVCLSGCQFFSDVCITFPCYSFTHLYSPPPLFLYPFQSKSEMIHTAKAIAANGQAIVHFANHIGEQCTDKRYVIIIIMKKSQHRSNPPSLLLELHGMY